MISAGSAVSESRTAPRTDCSASRFCGGAVAVSPLRWSAIAIPAIESRSGIGGFGARARKLLRLSAELLRRASVARASLDLAALLLFDDHRLDGRGDVVGDLDDDHARADGADRLVEVDLAAIDADAARLADGVDDVLRRDGAEQAPVVAGLVRDG